MTIGILATGDEIIHGDTLNTNSHDIAHSLSSEGIPLGFHIACSDKETEIIDSLTFLADRHDIIIVIGGLGPTSDDLTRFALGKFTNQPLVQHQKALTHIENRLRSNIQINQGNLQQCLFPKEAILLPNPNGTALGCYYQWQNKMFFLLPGPPRECLPMFQHHVVPLLHQAQRSKKHILKWRIFGLAESEIAQTLEDALSNFNCHTGYRLDTPYIEFKVRCTPDLVGDIKKVIDPLLAPHIIASPDKKASDNLRELILSNREPITIIDQVTGGLLETLLDKPGLHHLVCFNNLERTRLLFHLQGLDEYWAEQSPTGTTQLTIQYSNHQQEGGETHTIHYRSPLVVHHAAEWLCFRLFHLINQLH
jgi:molybdenum cofactor synthesis domain-containing protein